MVNYTGKFNLESLPNIFIWNTDNDVFYEAVYDHIKGIDMYSMTVKKYSKSEGSRLIHLNVSKLLLSETETAITNIIKEFK